MKTYKELLEDLATSDVRVKKWVDGNGVTRSRKFRAHRVDFKNSKANGEPSQEDEPVK
jgi:hypothetical protein